MNSDQEAAALVSCFATNDRTSPWMAYARLLELGEAAVPAVVAGLSHPDWRVRRGCALFADRYPDPLLMTRLKLTLHDPKARVRMMAVHALGCEHCKPGGNPVDPIPMLIDRLKNDKAIRVRRMAASGLSQFADEPRVVRAIRHALECEGDARLRKTLRWRLFMHERSNPRPA